MSAKKFVNKEKDDPVMNEAVRASLIIDKYIRNEDDRVELKKNLTPLIIQFLLRWDCDKEMVMEDRIIEIVMKKMHEIYVADNDQMCKNVAEIVSAQNKKMFDTLSAQTKLITDIATDIGYIKLDIKNIKDRLEIIEDKQLQDEKEIDMLESEVAAVKIRLDKKKARIEELESKVAFVQPELIKKILEDMELTKPIFARLVKYSSWKITLARMFMAMVVGSALVYLVIRYAHQFWPK